MPTRRGSRCLAGREDQPAAGPPEKNIELPEAPSSVVARLPPAPTIEVVSFPPVQKVTPPEPTVTADEPPLAPAMSMARCRRRMSVLPCCQTEPPRCSRHGHRAGTHDAVVGAADADIGGARACEQQAIRAAERHVGRTGREGRDAVAGPVSSTDRLPLPARMFSCVWKPRSSTVTLVALAPPITVWKALAISTLMLLAPPISRSPEPCDPPPLRVALTTEAPNAPIVSEGFRCHRRTGRRRHP